MFAQDLSCVHVDDKCWLFNIPNGGPVISVCFVLLIGCMDYKTQRKARAFALRQRNTTYYTA